jgi:prolyl-tRNA synthetase
MDAREEATPGWKFSEYEMRGVPLRIEIGPRDVKAGQAVLVRRDTAAKETVPLAALADRVPALLGEIQAGLMAQARAFLEANIRDAADYPEFKDILENKRGFSAPRGAGARRGADHGRDHGHDRVIRSTRPGRPEALHRLRGRGQALAFCRY